MTITFDVVYGDNGIASGASERTLTSGGFAHPTKIVKRAGGSSRRHLSSGGFATMDGGAYGTHRRRISTFGIAAGAAGFESTAGDAFGVHKRALRSAGTSSAGALFIPMPEIPAIGLHQRYIGTEGETYSARYNEGSATRVLSSFGFASSSLEAPGASYDGGIHTRVLGTQGVAYDPNAGYGIAMTMPFFMSGLGPYFFDRAYDVVGAGEGGQGIPQIRLLESLLAGGEYDNNFNGAAKIRDTLAAFGVEHPVVIAIQREQLVLKDVQVGDYSAVERVIESLLLDGVAGSFLEAVSKTTDALAAIEVMQYLMIADTADMMAMYDAADTAFTAIERLLDAGVLFATERQQLSIVARDELITSDEALSIAEIFALIRDGLGMVGHFRLDDGEYTAWVVNTESSGITTYDNFPFNSFATIGGVQFGMSTFGCFTLDADDDDGEDIAARLRVGMTDMGTRVLKTVTEAYIGFASPDKMILRTITPNPTTGALEAYDYYMKATANATVAPQRFEPGRGLKAVDWDFELENTNGAELELHSVELLPVKMSRRVRS